MFIPFWIVQLGAYICVFIAGAVVMFVTGILINKRQEAKRKARWDADGDEFARQGSRVHKFGAKVGMFYTCPSCGGQFTVDLPAEGEKEWRCPTCKWWTTFTPDGVKDAAVRED